MNSDVLTISSNAHHCEMTPTVLMMKVVRGDAGKQGTWCSIRARIHANPPTKFMNDVRAAWGNVWKVDLSRAFHCDTTKGSEP
jgi:hypothetical protein